MGKNDYINKCAFSVGIGLCCTYWKFLFCYKLFTFLFIHSFVCCLSVDLAWYCHFASVLILPGDVNERRFLSLSQVGRHPEIIREQRSRKEVDGRTTSEHLLSFNKRHFGLGGGVWFKFVYLKYHMLNYWVSCCRGVVDMWQQNIVRSVKVVFWIENAFYYVTQIGGGGIHERVRTLVRSYQDRFQNAFWTQSLGRGSAIVVSKNFNIFIRTEVAPQCNFQMSMNQGWVIIVLLKMCDLTYSTRMTIF